MYRNREQMFLIAISDRPHSRARCWLQVLRFILFIFGCEIWPCILHPWVPRLRVGEDRLPRVNFGYHAVAL